MEQFLNEYGKTIILIGITINLAYQFFITIKAFIKAHKEEKPLPADYTLGFGVIMAICLLIKYLWDNQEKYLDWLGGGNNIFIVLNAILVIIAIINFLIPRKLN